jgi:two-component system, sensor histidine kinase LadS
VLILFAIVSHHLALAYRTTLENKNQALTNAAHLEEQRHFVALLSHEFRNPLATLGAAVSNLQRQTWDEAGHTRLGRMARAVGRLQYLLGYCLADDRLSVVSLDKRPRQLLSATQIVQESLYQLDDTSARLQQDSTDNTSALALAHKKVLGDLPMLGAALKNLLDNALKYATTGPINLSVAVHNEQLVLAVRDHGPGLDAQSSSRLFQKFARGDQQHLSGAGLGLYLSQRIVQQHGGHIDIRNAPDGGTVAELWLPLAGKLE